MPKSVTISILLCQKLTFNVIKYNDNHNWFIDSVLYYHTSIKLDV